MSLSDRARAELARRGVKNIRVLITNSYSVGGSAASLVPLYLGADNPTRRDVEDWLSERDAEAEQLDRDRHRQLLWWGKVAGIAALVGAGAAIIAVITPLLIASH